MKGIPEREKPCAADQDKIMIILPNCKETTTSSIKLCFNGPPSTSLTGLSALLRNAIFIFTPMDHEWNSYSPVLSCVTSPSKLNV